MQLCTQIYVSRCSFSVHYERFHLQFGAVVDSVQQQQSYLDSLAFFIAALQITVSSSSASPAVLLSCSQTSEDWWKLTGSSVYLHDTLIIMYNP